MTARSASLSWLCHKNSAFLALVNLRFRNWQHPSSAGRTESELCRAIRIRVGQMTCLEVTERQACRPRSGSATITGTIGKLVVRALFSIHQLTGRPIDCIFKLVSAGLARPHVSNAVIGKMLRPLGCDQNRTALRALIPCCRFHWPLPTRYPIWVRHPKSRDGGRIKTVLRRLRDLTLPKKRFDFPSHGASFLAFVRIRKMFRKCSPQSTTIAHKLSGAHCAAQPN